MTFSQLVRQQMKLKRLSIRKVCRMAELDPSFFAKVLRGVRYPPDNERVLRRLAESLGLDPLRLLLSVGRIPEQWQDRAQEPAVLNALSNLFDRTAAKEPVRSLPSADGRETSVHPSAPKTEKSRKPLVHSPGRVSQPTELSEDLL